MNPKARNMYIRTNIPTSHNVAIDTPDMIAHLDWMEQEYSHWDVSSMRNLRRAGVPDTVPHVSDMPAFLNSEEYRSLPYETRDSIRSEANDMFYTAVGQIDDHLERLARTGEPLPWSNIPEGDLLPARQLPAPEPPRLPERPSENIMTEQRWREVAEMRRKINLIDAEAKKTSPSDENRAAFTKKHWKTIAEMHELLGLSDNQYGNRVEIPDPNEIPSSEKVASYLYRVKSRLDDYNYEIMYHREYFGKIPEKMAEYTGEEQKFVRWGGPDGPLVRVTKNPKSSGKPISQFAFVPLFALPGMLKKIIDTLLKGKPQTYEGPEQPAQPTPSPSIAPKPQIAGNRPPLFF